MLTVTLLAATVPLWQTAIVAIAASLTGALAGGGVTYLVQSIHGRRARRSEVLISGMWAVEFGTETLNKDPVNDPWWKERSEAVDRLYRLATAASRDDARRAEPIWVTFEELHRSAQRPGGVTPQEVQRFEDAVRTYNRWLTKKLGAERELGPDAKTWNNPWVPPG
jgi:hypothetical protein